MELGRYRVLRPLGRGGMAEVFEAVAAGAEGWQRRVALKRVLPEHQHDPGLAEMFLDEARIASGLHHANIVSVLDFGVVDGLPFQVLELVDGLDAGRLWARGQRRGEPLPLPLALHLGSTIAHALHHAHTARDAAGQPQGIVHRDVSPANILVSWEGDVLLADFGIAIAKHRSTRTQTGLAKGTAAYWAPEQATGGQVDPRTDVFALAATLHRLMCGHSPLAGENALADLLVGRPLTLDPSLPDDVAEVLARALQRDKGLRHTDAAELAAALGTCMSRRLVEDPRSALRRWLSGLREPEPVAGAGRLDGLLGLEWIVVEQSDGVRTFASRPTPTAAMDEDGARSPTSTAVAGASTAPGTNASPPAAPGASVAPVGPESIVHTRTTWPRPVTVSIVALVLALAGLGFGGWMWWASRPEPAFARGSDPPTAELPRQRPGPTGVRSDQGTTSAAAVVRSATTTGVESVRGSTSSLSSTGGAAPESSPGVAARPRRRARPGVRADRPTPEPKAGGTAFLSIGGKGALRAQIVVDGSPLGHAPRRLELSTGGHHVVLEGPQGRIIAERNVDLRPVHTPRSPLRWTVPE